jgi:hypothetical protein
MTVAEVLTIRFVEAAMQGDIKKAKFLLNNEAMIVESSQGYKPIPPSCSVAEAMQIYRENLRLGQTKLRW